MTSHNRTNPVLKLYKPLRLTLLTPSLPIAVVTLIPVAYVFTHILSYPLQVRQVSIYEKTCFSFWRGSGYDREPAAPSAQQKQYVILEQQYERRKGLLASFYPCCILSLCIRLSLYMILSLSSTFAIYPKYTYQAPENLLRQVYYFHLKKSHSHAPCWT